jgi:CheY-like chemotaxis protein
MVILNDILDFSKIEAGKLNIEAVEFSLADLVQESLKSLVARAEKKALRLTCTLAPGLPARVVGDPVRIRQVLTNLCDNAIKFTAHGGVVVEITAEPGVSADGNLTVEIAVRDTGIGIDPDKQSGVFAAFHQADTSITRQFGGTGLGLTICARLVELMGGRIWLESVPGQGSTFRFTVHVNAPDTDSAHLASPTPTPQAPALPDSSAMLVLLVEDHPINQMLVKTLLGNWGHTVVVANNGQEAVDLFPNRPWSAVLMDMQMPVMGGLDATRALRLLEGTAQHTPIIAMTANAMEADRQACLDAGMDDYLAKPFNATALQAMLVRYVKT